jgi:hypothetical protein
VWFAYTPDRKGIHPQTHLANYEGVLQADAYAGYVVPEFMLRRQLPPEVARVVFPAVDMT